MSCGQYASTNPPWTAIAQGRVFNNSNGRRKLGFDILMGLLVIHDESTRRAMICFAYSQFARFRRVTFLSQAPHSVAGVTEACESAKLFRVVQRSSSSVY